MMSSRKKLTPMLNDYLYEAIRRVAIEQGFTPELFSVDFDEETAIECDGFVYFVFKAIVNEDDREFVLWCKVPPNDDQRSLALFKREVFFFREILPAFYKFQTVKDTSREKGAGFYDMPKCYLAHCDTEKEEPEAAIILEYDENHEKWDWDKLKPIDLDHSKVLMEQLGQFHAILFAMKSQKPELFEKFTSEQDTASSETNEPYCADSHSDCWIDNLIYKHNENNAATNVTLTDWHASPLLDLSYFFFICVGAQFRKDNLLQHYHNALEKLLDRLEGNTATQFPVADLLRIVQSYRRLLKDE
ncbi:uncharacterized protein LOC134217043 isoform X2 [Armigeres subalbatus]|uniref:uncharacterized protein LOC134217043 isoform X2 n=1 Tax=Armigeres subalbatus TaxID=124917 RepID=UPI002ED1B89E